MVYMKKDRLASNHRENNMKKHQGEKTLLNTQIWKVHIFEWNVSRVETPKEIDVLGVWDVNPLGVAEPVRLWSGDLLDDERPFPMWW